jgi:hypothetical protein
VAWVRRLSSLNNNVYRSRGVCDDKHNIKTSKETGKLECYEVMSVPELSYGSKTGVKKN